MMLPILSLTLLFAVLLDQLFGEPKKYHPLVGFGAIAQWLEQKMNRSDSQDKKVTIVKGVFSWSILVLPLPLLCFYLLNLLQTSDLHINHQAYIRFIIEAVIIYWALGLNSLRKHGLQIYHALADNDLVLARKYCGFIVSRETQQLNEQAISRCTTESMLENSNDAVTATLILYVLGGAPLVILHRLANTLDAMWGYKNSHFNYFGRCAARADDLFAFIPAKITSVCYALLGLRKGLSKGLFKRILINAYTQAQQYKSHNGGWVMAAGATLLQVRLGDASATYHGKIVYSPLLGEGELPQAKHIKLSLASLNHVILLLLLLLTVCELL